MPYNKYEKPKLGLSGTKRICLRCNKPFKSIDNGNRICTKCKSRDDPCGERAICATFRKSPKVILDI